MTQSTEVTTPATIPEVTHHTTAVNGTTLHYVVAGDQGSPVLLVHGFPESWWAFHKVIPLLARHHRVIAVDLRGFGDSAVADEDHDSSVAAEDLHQLARHLGLGPLHVSVQDIAAGAVFRWAHAHPDDLASLTAVETGLGGFGAEALADGGHGGAWYIAALTTPGVAEMLLAGREQQFVGQLVLAPQVASEGSFTPADVEELARGYARPGGWRGARGLYRAMLSEGEELTGMVGRARLQPPVLAVGGSGGPFTVTTFRQVAEHEVAAVQLEGVGHYVAMEAPRAFADAILGFVNAPTDQLPESSVRLE